MFKTRLNEYLDQYPCFLDKSEDSNFTTQVKVYNKQRKELLQQCNNLRLSQNIIRPLQIQKVQTQAKSADFYFYIYITNIKSIIIEQYNPDGTSKLLVNEEFNEKGHNYYTYNTFVEEDTIIPHPNFMMTVTTFDEYTYKKGYPENDTLSGNEYDHDKALDKLGKILGVTRYHHINVSEVDLHRTIPPYFDEVTEDDYYYMKRILQYVSEFGVTNLPILNFWRDYGVNVQMYNRKRLLTEQEGVECLNNWIYDNNKKLWYCLIDDSGIDKLVDTSNSLINNIKLELEGILYQTEYPKVPTSTSINIDKTIVNKNDKVTVTGVIKSNNAFVEGVTVDLLKDNNLIYKDDGTLYSNITDKNGEYTIIYPVINECTLNTVVVEDDEHLSSISNPIQVNVNIFDGEKYLQEVSNGEFYNWNNNPNYNYSDGILTGTSLCGGISKVAFTTKKDWKISFDCNLTSGDRGGVLFGDNTFTIGFYKDVGNLIQLIGNTETLTSTSYDSGWKHWIVEYKNNTVTLTIDDNQVTSFEADGLTPHLGLNKWGGSTVQLKNLNLETI